MSIASTGDKVTAPADRHRALDGLRAVAVVYVLVFHFWTRLLPGGFVGVDLFFVLSGFLINSLLMEQIERRGRIDVLTFLKRRYLRLGVPLSLMVVSTLVAVAITSAHLLPATCVDSVWVLTYTSNWKRAYIELFGGSLFFSHTWSLGVEEWFYVGWPFLLVSLHRRTSCAADFRESAVRAAILIIAAIEVWRLVLVGSGATPMRIYHGTDTRLDEIVLGCLLALLLKEPSRVSWLRTLLNRSPALPVVCLLGLPAEGAMMPIESSAIAFLGYPLFGLLSAVVVAAARFDERGAFAAVLSRSAIGYVGRLSYGVYLWHIPVHELTRSGGFASGAARDALSVCVTFLLAASTYHFVEGPIRRSAARGQRVSVGTPVAPAGRVDPLRPVTTSVAVV